MGVGVEPTEREKESDVDRVKLREGEVDSEEEGLTNTDVEIVAEYAAVLDTVVEDVAEALIDAVFEGLRSITGGARSVDTRPLPNWPLLLPPQHRAPPSNINVHV